MGVEVAAVGCAEFDGIDFAFGVLVAHPNRGVGDVHSGDLADHFIAGMLELLPHAGPKLSVGDARNDNQCKNKSA